MLSLLARDDLKALGHNTPAYVHLVAEVMKLCFADRDRYYGDPRFVPVPMDALLVRRLRGRAPARSCDGTAWPEMPPAGACRASTDAAVGQPPPCAARRSPTASPALPGDTSYVCVVDRHGNALSATPSDVSWESPVIPGLGFVPRRAARSRGRCPAIPRASAPGKRPRLTPNPAMAHAPRQVGDAVRRPGRRSPAAGMLQVFLNHTVFGMSVQEAVEAPRFVTHSFPGSFEPHPYHPGRLDLERGIGASRASALAALRPPSRVASRPLDRHSRRVRDRGRPRARRPVRRRRPAPGRPRHGLVK